MNQLIPTHPATDWERLKILVLDSVPSPVTRRVYNTVLD